MICDVNMQILSLWSEEFLYDKVSMEFSVSNEQDEWMSDWRDVINILNHTLLSLNIHWLRDSPSEFRILDLSKDALRSKRQFSNEWMDTAGHSSTDE